MIKVYQGFGVDTPSSGTPSTSVNYVFSGDTQIVNYEFEGRTYTKITKVTITGRRQLTSTTYSRNVSMETDDGYSHQFSDLKTYDVENICVISDEEDFNSSGDGYIVPYNAIPVGGKYKITGSLKGVSPYVKHPLRFKHKDIIYYAIYTSNLLVESQENKGPFSVDGMMPNPFSVNDIIEISSGQYMLEELFNSLNLVQLFENKYTVYDTNGTEITSLDEVPPVKHIKLTYSLGRATLKATGTNDAVNTLEWDVSTPEGTKFLGLSFVKGARRPSIPVGYDQDISIEGDLSLYEVFGRDYTPSTTFSLNVYKNSAEPNKVDKTNELVFVQTLNGVLRESSSIVDPEFNIAQQEVPQFNYVYIPNFQRYYYVTNITSVNNGLWRLSLHCDVLMTYKDGIKALSAFVERNENEYDENIVDKNRSYEQGYDVQAEEVTTLFFSNAVGPNFLISGTQIKIKES